MIMSEFEYPIKNDLEMLLLWKKCYHITSLCFAQRTFIQGENSKGNLTQCL